MMFQPPKFLLQERQHSAMMEYVVKGILNVHKIWKKRIFYIYDCDSVSGRARGCSWNGCKIRLKV